MEGPKLVRDLRGLFPPPKRANEVEASVAIEIAQTPAVASPAPLFGYRVERPRFCGIGPVDLHIPELAVRPVQLTAHLSDQFRLAVAIDIDKLIDLSWDNVDHFEVVPVAGLISRVNEQVRGESRT